MDYKFINFAEENLGRKISHSKLLLARKNRNNRSDADLVEINNLLFIWNDLPLRGKSFFINESNRIFLKKQLRYLQTPIPSYNEYINIINIENFEYSTFDRKTEINKYNEDILSKEVYESLLFDQYAEIFDFKKPRPTSAYLHFTSFYRQGIINEDISFTTERRSLSSIDEKLRSIWDNLPDKGKMDY